MIYHIRGKHANHYTTDAVSGPKIIPVELGFRNVDEGELDEDIPPGYLGAG
jgi:hypothetical protein